MVSFVVRMAPYSVVLPYYVVYVVSFVARMAPYFVLASNSISDSMRKRIKIVCGAELVNSLEVELSLLMESDPEYVMDRRKEADVATR